MKLGANKELPLVKSIALSNEMILANSLYFTTVDISLNRPYRSYEGFSGRDHF